ncbi:MULTISPECIES: AarF/ABC1/UbiB kinase family protein [unclassified Lentimonas]|uniref:ABC1 kinase family protein n=1 Tax=unclassified Lentimonas TaxID=2630993 RepID=UPI00132A5DBE|nr:MULTISPECIES: AarF/UbiB family protein [unclassified Lentimonas]CAA6679981.1 Ubiquinone biosynthesis monooxygenase UbiB [Lentimonas sp. CC4]CAA6686537.1 Ubiquinone biosynthesis monooxygenase UbiB [Lentimonas sp. CC6]CAA6690404.1 Ubiquinone biosynthesis monooxygenase UbiB [Lentimonas sp. CC19]CAA6693903.1 Ubiquinone biosynthesis monooxygenase UbiB [Lentimonas sp. CC10]CAA7068608.1 Ubiquinone biosynthesis monooxygenase UbiB [Lentimonas sp. CC11]
MKPFNYLSNAVRAPEIVAILVRWGFEDLLLQLDTPQFLLRNLVRQKVTHLTPYERVRNACEELGPIFVKFGQILSTRPDRLPEPLVMELKKLRSQVEPQAFEKIEPVLLKDLGCPIDEVFADFEPIPVAAGSLGQVYKAKLISTGEWVSVKVQRADIHKTISSDLEIIGWFAKQLHARVEELRPYNLPMLVSEAEKRLEEELNYNNEADNAEIFRALNTEQERVFAPKVYTAFTTRRLLVTEWVDGVAPDQADLPEADARELAKQGGESVFHQIVGTGFFHSDPHSGNMLITPDQRICWLDWGQAGQITLEMRYLLVDLFAAITDRNAAKVIRVAERMAVNNRRIDRRRVEKEVTFLLNKHRSFGPSGTKIGTVGLEMLYIFGSNGIEVSPDYALLSKAILCVEETARSLDPEFDILSVAKPFLVKLNKERWSVQSVTRQTLYPMLSMLRRMQQIPENMQRILQRIEEEDLQINFHHTGTENLEETFNASMNRLTVGIIIGSLLIGSSLIITTGVGPLLFGFPAIGILGFLVSGILGMYIVVSTLRKHR